jgi:O-antigen ligase
VTSQTERTSSFLASAIQVVSAALLVVALLLIQTLIGGTRLIFAFPAYALIALVGILSLGSLFRARPKSDQLCLWSAVLFFGYVLCEAVYSPLPYEARFDIYPVLAGVVVYFFTSCVLTSPRARTSIMACLLVAAMAHVLVGLIQFRGANNFMPISFLQRFDYGWRASGFYICPNHLAGLLEVLGIFGISIVCWSRWPVWSKLLVGYAVLVCYTGLILTGSRGGYLSVAASLLVFGVLSVGILRATGSAALLRLGIAGAIAAVLAMTAALSLIRHSDHLSERTNNILDYRNMRLELWQAALEQWKQSPLLGTGSRTYLVYGRKYRSERMQMDPIYAHNDYLQLLAEYGIVGAGTFLVFLAAHSRRGWIEAQRLGPKRISISHRLASNSMALNVGALCALAAYIVHSIFDFNLHIPANVLVLAFVFGIIANPGVIYEAAEPAPARSLIFWRVLIVAVAAILAVQVWRLAPGEYFAEKARAALRDSRFLSTIAFANQGLRYEKRNPLLYYYLGRGRALEGDLQRDAQAAASFYKAALPAYAKARELAPLDRTYIVELALTCDSLRQFEDAEALFGEARALDPRSTSVKAYYQAHLDRWKAEASAPKENPETVSPPK